MSIHIGSFLTGEIKAYAGSTAPAGWLLCGGSTTAAGATIGNSASGANTVAGDSALELFTLLWNSWGSTQLPIFTSAGVLTTRGGSASADWGASKRLSLPDFRGRTLVGKDDMGPAGAAGKITTGGSGISGTTIGAANGTTETHLLTSAQSGTRAHNHSVPDHNHTIPYVNPTLAGGTNLTGFATNGPGGTFTTNDKIALTTDDNGAVNASTAHNNVQPSIIVNYIIKL